MNQFVCKSKFDVSVTREETKLFVSCAAPIRLFQLDGLLFCESQRSLDEPGFRNRWEIGDVEFHKVMSMTSANLRFFKTHCLAADCSILLFQTGSIQIEKEHLSRLTITSVSSGDVKLLKTTICDRLTVETSGCGGVVLADDKKVNHMSEITIISSGSGKIQLNKCYAGKLFINTTSYVEINSPQDFAWPEIEVLAYGTVNLNLTAQFAKFFISSGTIYGGRCLKQLVLGGDSGDVQVWCEEKCQRTNTSKGNVTIRSFVTLRKYLVPEVVPKNKEITVHLPCQDPTK